MMLISIIIPIFNTARYIKRLCDSLKVQNLRDVELIFIDDCSIDNSVEQLEACLSDLHHTDVKVIKNESNIGIGNTRNKGIQIAQGDYVIFIDSDDFVSDNYIFELKRVANNAIYDIIVFDYIELYKTKQVYKKCTLPNERKKIIANLLIGKLHNSFWNKLIKRSLYLDNNILIPKDMNYLEDKAVCFQLFEKANEIFYINCSLYYYDRTRNTSLTTTNNRRYIFDALRLLTVINNHFKEKKTDPIISSAIQMNRILNTGYIALMDGNSSRNSFLPQIGCISLCSFFKKFSIPIHYKVAAFCYYYNLQPIVSLLQKTYSKFK